MILTKIILLKFSKCYYEKNKIFSRKFNILQNFFGKNNVIQKEKRKFLLSPPIAPKIFHKLLIPSHIEIKSNNSFIKKELDNNNNNLTTFIVDEYAWLQNIEDQKVKKYLKQEKQ